jgi:hypothetical protein
MSVSGVEGAGEVAAQPAFRTGFDDQDIEAHNPGSRTVISQPRRSTAHEPCSLAGVDGLFGHPGRARAPRLDLDECEDARTARDQIDLYAVAAGVACENPPTARGEMTRCTRLSFGPEGQV